MAEVLKMHQASQKTTYERQREFRIKDQDYGDRLASATMRNYAQVLVFCKMSKADAIKHRIT